MNASNPHDLSDRFGRAMDRAVAAKLRRDPQLVRVAVSNLSRWSLRRGGAPVNPAFEEWSRILAVLTSAQLAEFLESDSPMSNRLRQSSPWAGVLTKEERLKLLEDCETRGT